MSALIVNCKSLIVMNSLHLQLVTPERTLLDEQVDSISCPTSMGQITVLPGHVPLVANLVPGELITRVAGQEKPIHVSGGFVEIKPENTVIILADAAEHIHELDLARAEEATKRAQETLSTITPQDEMYAAAAASLEKHLSRLRVARKHSHRHKAPITSEGVLEE